LQVLGLDQEMTMLYQAPWGFLSENELLRTHPGCGCAGSGEKSALLSFQGEMHAIAFGLRIISSVEKTFFQTLMMHKFPWNSARSAE